MPRKTVVVVSIVVVSVRCSAWPDWQVGSSMFTMPTVANPLLCTQVVSPCSNVHVAPPGGITGGAAEAEAGRPTDATAAAATAAHKALLMATPSDRYYGPGSATDSASGE